MQIRFTWTSKKAAAKIEVVTSIYFLFEFMVSMKRQQNDNIVYIGFETCAPEEDAQFFYQINGWVISCSNLSLCNFIVMYLLLYLLGYFLLVIDDG